MDPQNRTPLQKVIPKITWFVRLEAQHVREFFFVEGCALTRGGGITLRNKPPCPRYLTGASQEDEFRSLRKNRSNVATGDDRQG